MTQPLRIGFAGCGEVAAEKHMPAVAELKTLEICAAADVDPARLAYVERRFGIRRRYNSYRQLVADADLDAVAICLPPVLQVDASIAALDAGKHVWIDPPTGLTVEDSDRLMERAARSDRTVMVGFHMRWHRLVREAREIIASGALGTPHAVRAVWTSPRSAEQLKEWRRHRKLGGGALVEVALDHFDLWRYLLDAEIHELYAGAIDDRWDDAAAVVAGRMASGVLVSAVFAERANHDVELEVYGDTGRMRVSLTRFEGLALYPDGLIAGALRARLKRLAHFIKELPRALPRMHKMGDYRLSYRDQWQHFIDCTAGRARPQCTLDDGRRALMAMLAALESASTRAPVYVR